MFSNLKTSLTNLPGNLLGSITGGLVDMGLSNMMGGNLDDKYAKRAAARADYYADLAHKRSIDAYKRRYRWTMKDMKRAGLNPILAAQNAGFSIGNSPTSAAATTHMPSYTPVRGASAWADMMRAEHEKESAETEKQKRKNIMADTAKKRQEIRESMQKVINYRQQHRLMGSQEKEIIRRTKNLEQEWWVKTSEFNRNFAQAELYAQQGKLTKEQLNKIQYETKQIQTLTKKLQAELAQLRRIADVYDSDIGAILGYIKAVGDALPLNIGMGILKGATK